MLRSASALYYKNPLIKPIPNINTLSDISSYITKHTSHGKSISLYREDLMPLLESYCGNDWRRFDGLLVKNNVFEMRIKHWHTAEETRYKKDDYSIFKILSGHLDQKLCDDLCESHNHQYSQEHLERIGHIKRYEQVYPLGADDIFLSQSLWKIKNTDIQTATLQIKLTK